MLLLSLDVEFDVEWVKLLKSKSKSSVKVRVRKSKSVIVRIRKSNWKSKEIELVLGISRVT